MDEAVEPLFVVKTDDIELCLTSFSRTTDLPAFYVVNLADDDYERQLQIGRVNHDIDTVPAGYDPSYRTEETAYTFISWDITNPDYDLAKFHSLATVVATV